MEEKMNTISLRSAALIAGIVVLIMVVCAPFAEIYVYPKLIAHGNPALTVQRLLQHNTLFVALIYAYFITYVCDIIAAWALYILLRPVNKYLSLLAALFRLTYTLVAIVALVNVATVQRMLTDPAYAAIFTPEQLASQVMLLLNTFRYGFHFGLTFFGIYLIMIGILIWHMGFIPKVMGILVALSGLGYLITSLQPYLFPNVDVNFATYTFYGELIFMLWLLIRGGEIKEIYNV